MIMFKNNKYLSPVLIIQIKITQIFIETNFLIKYLSISVINCLSSSHARRNKTNWRLACRKIQYFRVASVRLSRLQNSLDGKSDEKKNAQRDEPKAVDIKHFNYIHRELRRHGC